MGLSDDKMAILSSFVEQPKAFLQQKSKYSPQSATVVGILKEMWNEMAFSMQRSTMDENTHQALFEEYQETTEESIRGNQKLIGLKKEDLAIQEKDKADATIEWQANDKNYKETKKFFEDSLEKTCVEVKGVHDRRAVDRKAELEAVTSAIAILEGDLAQYDKSFPASFLQVSSAEESIVLKKLPGNLRKKVVMLQSKTGQTIFEVIDAVIAEVRAQYWVYWP